MFSLFDAYVRDQLLQGGLVVKRVTARQPRKPESRKKDSERLHKTRGSRVAGSLPDGDSSTDRKCYIAR